MKKEKEKRADFFGWRDERDTGIPRLIKCKTFGSFENNLEENSSTTVMMIERNSPKTSPNCRTESQDTVYNVTLEKVMCIYICWEN